MRALASLAVCLLLFCSPAFAQFGGTHDGRPQEPVQVSTIHLQAANYPDQQASQKEAVVQALCEKKFDLQLVDTPLAEFVKQLESKLGVPVRMNVRALEDLSLTPDTPLTYAMTGLRAQTHLRLILRELNLTYLVTPYGVTITTQEDVDNHEEALAEEGSIPQRSATRPNPKYQLSQPMQRPPTNRAATFRRTTP
ncbi:hypothetical protein DTL42_23015 [Bremerella cremea]|uniref:Uncharacterized protein n=1 Tax=Bremerella cremea TaxID=1031537 RepID=A0A368KKY3_9BACT|nr:hypothetical protein [Bremerella cremea]RCS41431.1 hypothetical protein DTL42_23015 [Bremerella cremea]